MTTKIFSKALSVMHFSLARAADTLAGRSRKARPLTVDTPQALANVLANDFGAALFAIPKALRGRKGSEAAAFLRTTKDILVGEGGYQSRQVLLDRFIGLIHAPAVETMAMLCGFIEAPENPELSRVLAWDGIADDAVTTIRTYHSLASGRHLPKSAKSRHRTGVQPLAGEEALLAKEWASLRSLLSERGWRDDPDKWNRQKSRTLQQLDYLGFLAAPVAELLTSTVDASQRTRKAATRA